MRHIPEEDMQTFKDSLEAEAFALREELADRGATETESGAWKGSSVSVAVGEEADPTDVADNIEELITNVPLVGELEKQLREVEGALKRMKDGTYGICEVCHQEIPVERLEANPSAHTCIAHAE